jgi:hypothetical protein
MFDDAKARVLLREMSIWMHGYCSALGDDAPFTDEHLLAFTAGDGALLNRIQFREELDKQKEQEAATVPPPVGPTIVLQDDSS